MSEGLGIAGGAPGRLPAPPTPPETRPKPASAVGSRAYRGLLTPPAGLLALVYGGRPPGRWGTPGGDVSARPVAGS